MSILERALQKLEGADVPPESALAGQATASPAPPTAQQIAEGRTLGSEIATQLVQEIIGMGMPAAIASAATGPQLNDLVIEVEPVKSAAVNDLAGTGDRGPRPLISQSGNPVAQGRVVVLTRESLRSLGFLAPESQERRIASQYRQVKRPLVDNARGRGVSAVQDGHLIMVTSALPGEGKTFSSVNLALSLALEKDTEVLLVDGDVAKPNLSKMFDVAEQPGLLDVLQDDSLDIEALIIPTTIPGLRFLPAGRTTENGTELLTSARMREILSQLGARRRNRLVLFDSPPLLMTSESAALAALVGQIVVIVHASVTPQQAVLSAIGQLPEKWIGLVLNQCKMLIPGYYGYGTYA